MRRCLMPIVPMLLAAACTGGDARDGGIAVETTPISAIQGDGARSPREGASATVEGVIVGNFVDGLKRYAIQSERDDGDPATSEGLFVVAAVDEDPARPVGQRVRVAGRVSEIADGAGSRTSLVDATIVTIGQGRIAPVVLTAPPSDWERYEGMLVEIAAPLTVTGNENLARFGELTLSFGGRLFAPTELARPGPEAEAVAARNRRDAIRIDDGSSSSTPAAPWWYLPQPWNDGAPMRVGTGVTGVTGVVDESFGSHRIQLTAKLAQVAQAPRPPAPAVAGDHRIAGFNVLNLFNGDGEGGGFPTGRGAATHEQYLRQQAKLAAAVQAMDPDLAALMELENDGHDPRSALAQFVAALNAAGPHRDWRFVDAGKGPGADAIRVGLIYRSSRFTAVGRPAVLVDGPFSGRSRAPLAQAFRAGRGPVFVVVANHFKSKGGCAEATGSNADAGDGQGCHNATRVDSAQRLHEWLATDPTGTRPTGTLIVGDLNAHAHEDPVHLLRGHGWQDAFALTGSERPYSYVWTGLSARLDHALLDAGLAARLRGAAEWHSNADESDRFDYRQDRDGDPYRASDHDPLLLGLDLAE